MDEGMVFLICWSASWLAIAATGVIIFLPAKKRVKR